MLTIDPAVQIWVDRYGDWFLEENKKGSFSGLLDKAKMTSKLYPYKNLFSPVQINALTLKNRIAMAPMGNVSLCDEAGRPDEKTLRFFFERARGGAGLIAVGPVPVGCGPASFSRTDPPRPAFAGWRDLAQGVHGFGARVFMQFSPGLGRAEKPRGLFSAQKFSNSAPRRADCCGPALPRAPLRAGKLKEIIRNLGQAAADAKAAGLDGACLHGNESCLVEQMSNGAFNRRRLGRYADKEAFGIDCVREMRERTGPDFPITYRIDLSLALNETYGEGMKAEDSLKRLTGGRTAEETLAFMKNLAAAGVDAFDVDLGCHGNWWLPHPPSSMPPGCFLEVSAMVKDYFGKGGVKSGKGLPVPVTAVGKLGYPDLAESALLDGKADMVMLGRPLLADPHWANKAYAGRVDEIRPCIGCQEGCVNEFVQGRPPQCAVNPRAAFERIYPAEAKKKIAVIGAGPAGVAAAAIAARRGHEVTLFEKSAKPGGRLIPGGTAKINYEIANYRSYLENLIKKAKKENKLRFKPNTEADLKTLKKQKSDVVIFAQGAKDATIAAPGIESAVQAAELFMKPALLGKAKKAVVIGGGATGCETAYWLHYEKNCEVTVVEKEARIMNRSCAANRGYLIYYLKKGGVKLLNCARLVRVNAEGVEVMRNVSKTVPDPYVVWHPQNPPEPKLAIEERRETIPADIVVIAAGGVPDDALYLEALAERAAPELYNIGDGFSAGSMLEANRAAYRLAREL